MIELATNTSTADSTIGSHNAATTLISTSVSLQISVADDPGVMRDVPGGDPGERANGKRIAAGDSAPAPGLGRDIAEQGQGRLSHRAELLDVACPRPLVGAGRGNGDVLVEARKRAVEAAR